MTSENSETPRARVAPSSLMTLFLVLVLSLAALIYGISILETYPDIAYIVLLFGFLGTAIAAYALIQIRMRLSKLRIVVPPVTTTIECKKCNFKNVREFQRGDYILKELEPCQKCNDKMMITAIYREVKEKEKERFPY